VPVLNRSANPIGRPANMATKNDASAPVITPLFANSGNQAARVADARVSTAAPMPPAVATVSRRARNRRLAAWNMTSAMLAEPHPGDGHLKHRRAVVPPYSMRKIDA
jgi:hypothetical protein